MLDKHQPADPQTAYLLDASIYIFRSYFSVPNAWWSPDGYELNAVYGYTRFLLNFLRRFKPVYLNAAFDESLGTCFRNELYPAYKARRELPDESLAFQLHCCKTITELLGIRSFACSYYEADDYIASLCALHRKARRNVCIVSRDKDLGQLLRHPEDCLFDAASDKRLGILEFEQKFGVHPSQFVDYQAIVGDPIDDLPGVAGIGAKTAAALLGHFSSLGEMLDRLHEIEFLSFRGASSCAKKIAANTAQIRLSQQLAWLKDDIPLQLADDELRLQESNRVELASYLDEIGLSALARQLDARQAQPQSG